MMPDGPRLHLTTYEGCPIPAEADPSDAPNMAISVHRKWDTTSKHHLEGDSRGKVVELLLQEMVQRQRELPNVFLARGALERLIDAGNPPK